MIVSGPPFNSDLYVAGVSVTPVYFLALLLPGGVLARYSKWAASRSRDDSETAAAHSREVRRRVQQAAADLARSEAITSRHAMSGITPEVLTLQERDAKLRAELDALVAKLPQRTLTSRAPWIADSIRAAPIWFFVIYSGLGAVLSAASLANRQATNFEAGIVTGSLLILPTIAVVAAVGAVYHEIRADRALLEEETHRTQP